MSGPAAPRDVRAGVSRLLRPRAIAIVGASDRVGPGYNAWLALERVGFTGRVYLVNPSRPDLLGQRTYPSLDAIEEPVDTVFVAVPQAAVVSTVRAAAARGAGGAVVLSSGFGEAGPEGARAQDELTAVATAHGLAVCGPNCLGYLNFAGGTAAWGTTVPDQVARGGVAAVVQSGSIGIALLNAGRELGLAYLVTSGNEAVTTAGDYLDALVDEPDVRVVIAFLEQLRQPRRFLAAARRATALGKPVLVVKTGRTERGRQAVLAHTGAVAGADEVIDAALRAAGVMRVDSLDELIETAALCAGVRGRPRAPGVAIVSPSGGEIALALDLAEPVGLPLPAVPGAGAALAGVLPDFAHVGNPLDLTWAGLYDPAVARRCAEALGAEPAVGTLVLLQDAPRGLAAQQAQRYTALVRAVGEGAAGSGVPLVVVSNLAVDFHPEYEAAARAAGAPCLRGTSEGLLAVARWARWATAPPPGATVDLPPQALAAARAAGARARTALAGTRDRALAEAEARAILAAAGIDGPRERRVATVDETVQAARELGWPVVVKGVVAGVAHKTEAGLVRVGLDGEDALRAEATAMLARVRALGAAEPALLVQEQVRPVAELLVGGRVDPEIGPVVVVGGGGVLVELYRDVAVRLAPVSEAAARAMLEETRAVALLRGYRGRARGDVDAVARAVSRLSALVAELRDDVTEIEVNPLAVLETGAVALDALVVGRA